jgi:hypothetical protein
LVGKKAGHTTDTLTALLATASSPRRHSDSEITGRGHAGIVYDGIDAIPGRKHFVAHRLDRGVFAHIDFQRHRADTELGDQAHGVLRPIQADIGTGHPPAVLGKTECQRPTESAAGTGDEHATLIHSSLRQFAILRLYVRQVRSRDGS